MGEKKKWKKKKKKKKKTGARPIRKNQKINSPEEDAVNISAYPRPVRPCRGSWTKAIDPRYYFSLLCSFTISTFLSSFFFFWVKTFVSLFDIGFSCHDGIVVSHNVHLPFSSAILPKMPSPSFLIVAVVEGIFEKILGHESEKKCSSISVLMPAILPKMLSPSTPGLQLKRTLK
jgi:hypothetical protein